MSGQPRKKKKILKVEPPAQPPQEDTDAIHVQNLLNEILREKLKHVDDPRQVTSLTTALINTLNEFLSSYILLSYTMEGQPVVITRSKNEMESDALTSLLMKYFTVISNRLYKSINENPFE